MKRFIAFAFLAFSTFALADEPYRLICPRLASGIEPPVMDGRADETAWTHAAQATLKDAATNAEPARATALRLLWDDQFLYIAFQCEDDPKPNARLTVRDANLWEEEVVEVFIDADDDQTTYFELEVNPLNTLFDAFILNNGQRTWVLRDWNMRRIEHAVAFSDTGWSVEIALPFEELAEATNRPPKPGDEWRVNLYRIDRSDDPAAPEMTAWSPPRARNFHLSNAFGRLVFGEAP